MKYVRLTSITCFLLLFAAAFTAAQTTTGSMTGTIRDAHGAVLPNVRVELENVATGQRVEVTTDASGIYRFTDVPVGRYRVITQSGSVSAPVQEVEIALGRTDTINLTLPSGPATDPMVSSEAVPTDSMPASIARNYNTRYMHYHPNPNYMSKDGTLWGGYNLSLLSEGITSGGFGIAKGPAVTGMRPISNSYGIDGIDNNNKVMPGPLIYVSNEATTEFALFQNQPSPLFGHAMGGKFNSVVRTGTNQWHGAFYDYLQNRKLNAMEPGWRSLGLTENPRYDQNRMGASLGVPVVPSKFFFFGNFEYIPLGFERPLAGASFAPTAVRIRGTGPQSAGFRYKSWNSAGRHRNRECHR